MIPPPTSRYQKMTSYSASLYCFALQSWYSFIARPAKRWIIPSRNENTSSRIGSSTGINHTGGIVTSFPKKVLATTSTTSPK